MDVKRGMEDTKQEFEWKDENLYEESKDIYQSVK